MTFEKGQARGLPARSPGIRFFCPFQYPSLKVPPRGPPPPGRRAFPGPGPRPPRSKRQVGILPLPGPAGQGKSSAGALLRNPSTNPPGGTAGRPSGPQYLACGALRGGLASTGCAHKASGGLRLTKLGFPKTHSYAHYSLNQPDRAVCVGLAAPRGVQKKRPAARWGCTARTYRTQIIFQFAFSQVAKFVDGFGYDNCSRRSPIGQRRYIQLFLTAFPDEIGVEQ